MKKTEHENIYEEWRMLLLANGIMSKDGLVDLEELEKQYPGELKKDQVVWIERMQRGEVFEEGEQVPVVEAEADVAEPEDPEEKEEETPKVKPAKHEKAPHKTVEPPDPEPDADEEKEEEEPAEESDEEDAAPPPPPGEARGSGKEKDSYKVGDTLKIQIEEGEDPEDVTVARMTKEGVYLTSSKDDDVEYLVSEDELKEMIV